MGVTDTKTYNYERNFFHGPTPKNNNPEEHGEGPALSNEVHFDWNANV